MVKNTPPHLVSNVVAVNLNTAAVDACGMHEARLKCIQKLLNVEPRLPLVAYDSEDTAWPNGKGIPLMRDKCGFEPRCRVALDRSAIDTLGPVSSEV